jgi:carboxypeptidase C (cathepsin A)
MRIGDAVSASMFRVALAAALCAVLGLAPGVSAADNVGDGDQVASLPDLPVTSPQFAGYASTSAADCADVLCGGHSGLFYWLATQGASYQNQPTILWSNGGPGASSMYGFFSENGPYTIDAAGNLAAYGNSWTSAANYLVFDHPLGVGLSFPVNGVYANNLEQGITQLRTALSHVLERRGLQQSSLYLVGESYGGTYMPVLAKQILDANERGAGIELGGVVIVAGWVDPLLQVGTIADYALTHGLISEAQKRRLDRIYARCVRAMDHPPPSTRRAGRICEGIQPIIARMSGRYLANIALTSDIDYGPIVDYLNRADVRAAIHARPEGTFELGSDEIARLYAVGEMDSQRAVVAELLDRGVPVMVVSGLNDAKDVNFIGTRKWIARMRWDRAGRYARADRQRWTSDGNVLGYTRSGGGLTLVEAIGAGHLAPRDQPRLIDQITRFMAANPPGQAGR